MGILRSLFRSERRSAPEPGPASAERGSPPDVEASESNGTVSPARQLISAGQLAAALESIGAGIAEAPRDASLHWARAEVLARWGRHREAVAAYKIAAALGDPEPLTRYLQRGWAEVNTGDLASARQSFARAMEAAPTAESHYALGFVLHLQKQLPEALHQLDRCLDLDPLRPQACIVAGACALIRNEPIVAERYFRRAIEIEPGNASAWANLGVALDRTDRDDEALAAYEEAARIERTTGQQAGGLTNFAIAVGQTGRVDEAIQLMAGDSRPPGPFRQYVHGLALVTAGRLAEGWPFHEFRWACEPLVGTRPGLSIPRWCGQSLAGRRIVIRAEQGYGDTLQFVRYAVLLKRLGATVYLRVDEGMGPAGLTFDGVDRVLTGNEGVEVDCYIPSMSLPAVFGTTLDSIPNRIPYVHVRTDLVERWSQRIAATGKLRVGVVWAGNPEHQRDRYRSVPLAALAPLFDVAGVEFFSLQKGVSQAVIEGAGVGEKVLDLASQLATYAETAAAIANLDLVISVDTSVAHLAGAMGCPTWVLLPKPADWRWMLDRADSPWYPTMRLFRQSERRRWEPVIEDVARALAAMVGEQSRRSGTHWRSVVSERSADAALPIVAPPLDGGATNTTRLAECRYGLMEYLPDEPAVGPSLAYYGEYLQPLLVDLLRLLPPGSTVVDVGAGIGVHTLGLATQVGASGHVIAFEHRPRHREALQHNLSSNRLRNVTIMSRPPRGAGLPFAGAPTDSIDDLQLEALACIKIGDGVQFDEVLAGGDATLWRLRPIVFSPLVNDGLSAAQLLRGYGYRAWRIETSLFSADNFNRWSEDIFAGRTASALIAIPEELDVEATGWNWVALD